MATTVPAAQSVSLELVHVPSNVRELDFPSTSRCSPGRSRCRASSSHLWFAHQATATSWSPAFTASRPRTGSV